jgi:hypothetical protein
MEDEMAVDAAESPELSKMEAVADESQSIGNFIDWLGENGMVICASDDGLRGTRFFPTMESTEALLARYFEIDLNKVEKERRAMLAAFTAAREGQPRSRRQA